MSNCNYNCAELPEHEIVECKRYLKGGIDALALLECNHGITDWTNTDQWETAIAANKVTIITHVKAEVPDASPNESESMVGKGPDTEVSGFDRTLTWTEGNVTPGNIDLINRLNRWGGGLVYRESNANRITVIDEPGTFIAMRSVPNSGKNNQMIKGTYKWSAFDEPAIYDEPAGIFD